MGCTELGAARVMERAGGSLFVSTSTPSSSSSEMVSNVANERVFTCSSKLWSGRERE